MSTETVDPRFINVERWPTDLAVEAMLEGQLAAIAALKSQTAAIAGAAEAGAARLNRDGRLIYAGAGTSGRLAVQDGVELGPTYNWPAERLVFLLAGGTEAMLRSVEGAEDKAEDAVAAIEASGVREEDVVIGVAASGRTPFVIGALNAARAKGALTIAISNNAGAPILAGADHAIVAETGAEIVAGSTRMKAGTAQKAALNMLSTAMMLRSGLVHRGLMVNMRVSNEKLLARARRMVATLGDTDEDVAEAALKAANNDLRTAVLVARGLTPVAAVEALASAAGDLGTALQRIADGD